MATQWENIRAKLLAGTYVPTPVRRKDIEKPGGDVRTLGIPTVLDRFIQQLLLQVMTTIWRHSPLLMRSTANDNAPLPNISRRTYDHGTVWYRHFTLPNPEPRMAYRPDPSEFDKPLTPAAPAPRRNRRRPA
jgi:hypothetical protein